MAESPRTVRVQLGERSYDIEIGSGNLARVAPFVTSRRSVTHAVVITDSHVRDLYADRVATSLSVAGIRTDLLTIPAGEAHKSLESASSLWNELVSCRADRKSLVIAVGGGVIGDLAGFVAATFARGLPFFQIPTTLLAHVDSSVGGKVGINLPTAKNLVGAFWQPQGVLIDTATLSTLPQREFLAGLAEVVKYGVILDETFFAYLEAQREPLLQRQPDVMRYVIARCCQLKADVVEQDEREETGLRAVLNYGHTFCHAIETVSGYGRWLHGEAVAIGMRCAAVLARNLGRVDGAFCERQQRLLVQLGLPVTVTDGTDEDLIAAMQRDKKTEHGKLRFVLPDRLGHVELVGGVDSGQVRAALAECRSE